MADTLAAVYFLLRERVRSDFGLPREQVPARPSICDYRHLENPSAALTEAVGAWKINVQCDMAAWRTDADLDRGLRTPPQKAVNDAAV